MADDSESSQVLAPTPTFPTTDAPQLRARTPPISNIWSTFGTLIVCGFYEYLSIMGAPWGVLIFVWILAVIGVVISKGVWEKGLKQRIGAGITAAILLGVMLVVFHAFISRVTAKQQPTSSNIVPKPNSTVINQTAVDSPCANQVAQSGSQINCDPQKGKNGNITPKH